MKTKLLGAILALFWATVSLADVNTITLQPGSSATIDASVSTQVTCGNPAPPLGFDTSIDDGVQVYKTSNDCSKITPFYHSSGRMTGTAVAHITCGTTTYVAVVLSGSVYMFNQADVFTVPPTPLQ